MYSNWKHKNYKFQNFKKIVLLKKLGYYYKYFLFNKGFTLVIFDGNGLFEKYFKDYTIYLISATTILYSN